MTGEYYHKLPGAEDYIATINGDIYHYYETVGLLRLHPYGINGSLFVKIKGKPTSVAQIILTVFDSEKPGQNYRAYHLNDISIDNSIANLVWATSSEIRLLQNTYPDPATRRVALDAIRAKDMEKLSEYMEDVN